MKLLERVVKNAQSYQKRIVLPEGTEPRTLRATEIILKENIARITLLGNPVEIMKAAEECGVNVNGAVLVDPKNDNRRAAYADLMVEIRKSKGLTHTEALEMLNDPLVFACIMIKNGDADGEIAGAINATGDVLRPAFQFVKTRPGVSVVFHVCQ